MLDRATSEIANKLDRAISNIANKFNKIDHVTSKIISKHPKLNFNGPNS
ncbi:33548_t:CDS:1, partial [Gigaspora margarita]